MANVVMDAMIKRADFAQQTESKSITLFDSIKISEIQAGNPIIKMLRKPDFQRETNHWTPDQIGVFIDSFANDELIPSLILWKSDSLVFVIDGGHRLSALRAWVENDFGDGTISHKFYGGQLTKAQKKTATQARNKVESAVGRFSDLEAYAKLDEEMQSDEDKKD